MDVDLEKFSDCVDHDILIDRLGRRIKDAGVIRLIRTYLASGITIDGVVQERGGLKLKINEGKSAVVSVSYGLDLNSSNRPVRTRTPGGVAGGR